MDKGKQHINEPEDSHFPSIMNSITDEQSNYLEFALVYKNQDYFQNSNHSPLKAVEKLQERRIRTSNRIYVMFPLTLSSILKQNDSKPVLQTT